MADPSWLDIDTVDTGKLNLEIKASHYKAASIDENIMRQNYFMFLESGYKEYFNKIYIQRFGSQL